MKKSASIPSDATLCDVTKDVKAARALANATSKYTHVVPDNIWRAGDRSRSSVQSWISSSEENSFPLGSEPANEIETADLRV